MSSERRPSVGPSVGRSVVETRTTPAGPRGATFRSVRDDRDSESKPTRVFTHTVVNATAATWCSPDSAAYRDNSHCWDLPSTYDARVADGEGTYADYYSRTYLFDLADDPNETVDLKVERETDFLRMLAAFVNATNDIRDSQYYAACSDGDGDCDALYETWIHQGNCLVSPWL